MSKNIAPTFTIWYHLNKFFKKEGDVVSPIQHSELQKIFNERVAQAMNNPAQPQRPAITTEVRGL
jgi:hypothetical protein